MKHKILVISPTPTHPTNAGNRARILVYTKYLIDCGHDVHFLYSDQEDSDHDAMKNYWGDRFHKVSYVPPNKREYPRWLKAINRNYQYYSHVDDHYNELLDPLIQEINKVHSFTAVIVEYIFQSKALLNFGTDVIKVVDTHDVMTRRHQHFLNAGKPAVWYSTSKKEERIGINRADFVMAIQDREAAFYRTLTRKSVITVGHMVCIGNQGISEKPRNNILFVGSNNPNNFHAINDFIKFFLPEIQQRFPGIQLLIAGKICDAIENCADVVKMGEIPDIKGIYCTSDIVLNPLTIGTGLKIKMIEAIGSGKVVISTTIGAEGLESGAGEAYLIADNPRQFIKHLEDLFSNPEYFSRISERAIQFAIQYNAQPAAVLDRIFS